MRDADLRGRLLLLHDLVGQYLRGAGVKRVRAELSMTGTLRKVATTWSLWAVLLGGPPVVFAQGLPAPCEDRSCVSEGEAFRITLDSTPEPIPFNRPFELTIDVTERVVDPGQETCTPQLEISATMPEHGHGMTLEPRVERAGTDRFHVRGMLFHMPGVWWIETDVRCGSRQDRVVFEVVLE